MVVGRLGQPDVARGLFDSSLEHRFVQMMSPVLPGPRVQADLRAREHPLPAPFAVGVWILPLQRVRHIDPAEAVRQIMLVPLAHVFQMHRQRLLHSGWQHRSPILIALAFTE